MPEAKSPDKLAVLERGVDWLSTSLALPAPAACFALAQALFAWIKQPGHADLVPVLRAAIAEREGDRLPLFEQWVDPETSLRASAVPELATRVADLFSPLPWGYEDGELLGGLFEGRLGTQQRKKQGAFYTPEAIVGYLLERTLPPSHAPLPKEFRLLDPSCGAGNFLSAALEALFERVWTPESGPEGRHLRLKRVMERHLYGIDLNPWAVRLAQIRLDFAQLKLVPDLKRPFKAHLLGQDALQSHHPLLEPGFDVVVGNPPYGAELSTDDKTFFQRFYRLGSGRQETTALFVERSARLLRAGGRLGLVVPHGLTRTGAYAECRRLLVTDLKLRALIDLGSAFPGVNLETMAFVAERPTGVTASPALPWADHRPADVQLDTFRDGTLAPIGTQPLRFYLARPTMPIYVDAATGGWVERIEEACERLQDVAQIRRGAGISANQEAIALRTGLPVVRGRDIRRYGDTDGLLCLHGDYPLRDRYRKDVVAIPQIAFQNIASSVVATLLPPGCLPLDTVNVLDPDPRWEPGYLLALLNSRLLEAYFRLVIANRAQLTLHLDTPTLGSLPVLAAPAEEQIAIAHEVNRVFDRLKGTSTWELALQLEETHWETPKALHDAAHELAAENVLRRKQAHAILDRIDHRVCELYRVTESELAMIHEAAPRSTKRPPKEVAKAAELIVARGLIRVLERSDRTLELPELLRRWPRPDSDVLLQAWGGASSDLATLLGRYGAIAYGRRLGLWQPGFSTARPLSEALG